MIRALVISLSIVVSFASHAFDHSHKAWDALLAKHIKQQDGRNLVNYKEVKKDKANLDAYLKGLSAVPEKEFNKFSDDEKLAFLINAYNAFTWQIIAENYPLKTIKDLGGIFTSPWKREFFKLFGKFRHLDWIEHEMIRKLFKEPRIHFAVNCASMGCPDILKDAYVAKNLNKQLAEATKAFLKDRERNRLKGKEVQISKIFDWYGEDFDKWSVSVPNFVAPYLSSDGKVQDAIRKGTYKISHLEYDWGLNEAR